ncbi:SusC/RagA family TonB-linked outer membrane protein [Parapedobacter sp. 2B3]
MACLLLAGVFLFAPPLLGHASATMATDRLGNGLGEVPVQDTTVVSGKVTDTLGNPIAGVSVAVQGRPNSGTQTGDNGMYAISGLRGDVIDFSYVGYVKQSVELGTQTTLDVTLEVDGTELDEVIVVGFGTQKKITSVGAQASVSPKELKTPVRNLATVLAGRISGVIGLQRTGENGFENHGIWVRGISSISGGSSPLVLVDGVERPLQDVPPEDIESFSILKDASATAVYGVRGANGVILVNTRKGSVGDVKINAYFTQGISDFTKIPDLADGITFMRMTNEANLTRGREPLYTEEDIQKTIDGVDTDLYPNTNWFDEILDDYGKTSQFNVNMRGGSERANFYVSGSFINEIAQFKTDELQKYDSRLGLDRYNFTSNLSLKATPTTTVDMGVQGYIIDGNYPGVNFPQLFGLVMEVPSVVYPARYSDGTIPSERTGDSRPFNPYAALTQTGYRTVTRSQMNTNVKATQRLDFLTEGLSAYSLFAFDTFNEVFVFREKSPDTYLATMRDSDGNLVLEPTRIGTPYLGFARPQNLTTRRFYSESAVNYQRSFGDHEVTGMMLYNWSDAINNSASDVIGSLPSRFMGVAGRATYAFKQRYLFEVNAGYNGSENFAPSRRYGFFPSFGLGWVFSEEAIFAGIKDVVNVGKIRFTRGLSGNADIGGRRFAYIGTVGSGQGGYVFGKEWGNTYTGKDIEEYAVDVSWEKSMKTNIGIDLTLLKNNLNIQMDFFDERREGSFLRRSSLPSYIGLRNNPYGNLGISSNRGIDGSISFRRALSEDLHINLTGTVTYARSEVIDDDMPAWNYPWRERKGQKIGQPFGLIAEGLFTSDQEIANSASQTGDVRVGDIKYRDLNEDGVIDLNDEAPIGYGAFPELVYGARLGVAYKRFAVNAFFQGVGNVSIFANGNGFVPFQQGSTRGNLLSVVEDRWTVDDPNPNAFFPRLTFGDENMNYRRSSWWVKNGAFLRLKTLDVTYSFGKSIANRLKVDDVTLFFQGFNLLTFSKFNLWDVEMGDGRGAGVPQSKVYSLGLHVAF